MNSITQNKNTSLEQKTIVKTFHPLVRIAHWSNVFILLSLSMSGLSIYWASPVVKFIHAGTEIEPFTLIGTAALKIFPDQDQTPRNWFFNHFAMGSGNLAYALNIHWLFAYLFMGTTALYVVGSLISGSYKALIPRPGDLTEAASMVRFYLKAIPCFIMKQPNPHPPLHGKYNALQRFAYFSSFVSSVVVILTGWAIHKPSQLGWLQKLCGGYDFARLLHFFALLFFASFVVPHVVLVVISGWDCFRSMVVGWSEKSET